MKYNTFLFELLLLLALAIVVLLFYKSYFKQKNGQEGFQQKEKFILKENGETYDDFYGEIYDTLMLPEERIRYEMETILKTLQPDTKHARMLDIGSGTGVLVNYLKEKGYTAYGVDKSKAMVEISKERFPIDVKCANVEEAMAYDRSLFTHIFCMNFTIYEMENKLQLFKNCYYWLQHNSYLILHLAEKDNFNAIIPGGKPDVLDSIEQLGDKRVTTTIIDFIDYTYKSEYVPCMNANGNTNANGNGNTNVNGNGNTNVNGNNRCNSSSQVLHKETFTDKSTQNIRQNERVLNFDTYDDIVNMAIRSGFVAKGYFTMEKGPSRDIHQRIYIFERTL
jgi:SAM-dependent methyltransferase